MKKNSFRLTYIANGNIIKARYMFCWSFIHFVIIFWSVTRDDKFRCICYCIRYFIRWCHGTIIKLRMYESIILWSLITHVEKVSGILLWIITVTKIAKRKKRVYSIYFQFLWCYWCLNTNYPSAVEIINPI